MNRIIICVRWWWSHLHGDWLPHVLISCNVQPHHKWQLTLWQDFCMRSRAELGRGTPARYRLMIHWLWLNTKHGPDWHLSREGFLWLLAGWSYLSQILIVITTHKVILSYPPNSYIYRRAAPDLKLNKRSIMVSDSWWDQVVVVVVRVMLGWLSLFSLTVVTCVSVSSLPILKLPENGDNGAVMVFSPAQSARSLQRCFQ